MACVQYLVFSSSTSFPPCSSFPFSSHSCFSFFVSHNHYCLFPLLLFSHSVVSDSFRPHGLQHAKLLCPSLSPGVCSDSCPLSQWCHPTISSSRPLLLLPSIFLSIRIFSNELGGQSIGASASVLLMNIQEWFPLRLTGLILQFKGLSRVFSSTTVWDCQFFGALSSS